MGQFRFRIDARMRAYALLFSASIAPLCLILGCQASEPADGPEKHLLVRDTQGALKVYYTGDDKFQLSFENAPPFVHGLALNPDKREPELNKGTWLVLVFATASQNDVRSIVTAVRGVKKLDRDVQLGLRPFRDYDETKAWYQPYGSPQSPLWLVIRDGKVVKEAKGVKTEEEVLKFVKSALEK